MHHRNKELGKSVFRGLERSPVYRFGAVRQNKMAAIQRTTLNWHQVCDEVGVVGKGELANFCSVERQRI